MKRVFCKAFIIRKKSCEMFSNFPELLLIDATYKLNDLRMPLYIMMVVDGNGESEIVALWIVASEDRISIKVGSPEVSKTLNFFLHWRGMRCDVKFEFV